MFRKIIGYTALVIGLCFAGLFAWGYAPDIPLDELKADYANSESEFVDLGDGLTIHLRDEGPADAPAIILLHGSNASLHTWDEWANRLKNSYRIIRYDQQGHGLTGPHPKGDYSAAGLTDVVDRVAANRGLKRFTLGGNSMGGWVAHEYAKAHPEKLDGLILVDAGGAPDSKPRKLPIGFRLAGTPGINRLAAIITPRSMVEKSLRQSVSKAAFIDDAQINLYWKLLRRPGNRQATIERFSQRSNRMAETSDRAISSVPTLILWGEDDKLIPVASASWFAKRYPDNRTIIYKGVGHIPMQEIPERSASDVLRWMAREKPAQPK